MEKELGLILIFVAGGVTFILLAVFSTFFNKSKKEIINDKEELIDLTKVLKVGDTVWTIQEGKTKVRKVIEDPECIYSIICANETYTKYGKYTESCKYKSLFLKPTITINLE